MAGSGQRRVFGGVQAGKLWHQHTALTLLPGMRWPQAHCFLCHFAKGWTASMSAPGQRRTPAVNAEQAAAAAAAEKLFCPNPKCTALLHCPAANLQTSIAMSARGRALQAVRNAWQLQQARWHSSGLPSSNSRPETFVFLGPPGVGKVGRRSGGWRMKPAASRLQCPRCSKH